MECPGGVSYILWGSRAVVPVMGASGSPKAPEP